jgi:hypothetical protein
VIFEPSGQEIRNELLGSVDRSGGFFGRSAAIAFSGKEFLVGINSGRTLELNFMFDDFRLPYACWSPEMATLQIIDAKTLTTVRRAFIRNLEIGRIRPVGASYSIAGGVDDPCLRSGRAVLDEVSPSLDLRVEWEDEGPFDSNLVDAVPTDGAYRAVVVTQRQLAVDRREQPATAFKLAPANVPLRLSSEFLTRDEAAILNISKSGIEVHYLDAGLGTDIDAVATVDNQLVLAGTVGWSNLWVTIP